MESWLIRTTNHLLAQSWQIALLTVAVAAVSFALRNRSAHVRYLLWLIVLAKCLIPPLHWVPVAILPPGDTQLAESAPVPMPGPGEPLVFEERQPTVSGRARPASSQAQSDSLPGPRARPRVMSVRARLAVVWIVGVVVFLFVYLLKAMRMQVWLYKQRRELPTTLRRDLEGAFSVHTMTRLPSIWLIDDVGQPFVWGLLRGSIYLPANLTRVKDSTLRTSLVGHELSHVLRFDAAVNVLQVLAQSIFWFHPFVWWANRKLRQEREKCCDEATIARMQAPPEDYSSAIVEVLAVQCESTRPVPSLAVAGPVRNIEERIRTMLRPGRKFKKSPSLVAALTVLGIGLVTVPTALVLTARAGTETATQREAKSSGALHRAAAAGDIEQIRSLISEGTDVNAKDEKGQTALHAAALHGQPGAAQILIAHGADLEARDKDGCSPLACATLKGNDITAELLMAKGANVNDKDAAGNTPFHHAAIPEGSNKGRWIAIMRRLLAKGADVNARNDNGQTPAHVAAKGYRDAHGNAVLWLNRLGADVHAKDKAGNTPLHIAAGRARNWVTDDLIAKGANVKVTNVKGQTPLHIAAGHRHNRGETPRIWVVKALIAGGADVNAVDQRQWTALHEAACGGHTDIVQVLISSGADLDAQDEHGHTPAHLALRGTHMKVADLLIEKGTSISTPYLAAYLGDLTRLQNSNVSSTLRDIKDEAGFTPMHAAAAGGHKNVVEYLISQGVNANAEAQPGWTALSYAAAGNHMEVVGLLHSKGINAGKKASALLPMVAKRGYVDAAKILIDLGADKNVDNGSPLREATDAGQKEMVETLIAKGADVNAKGADVNPVEWSALHICAEKDRTDIAKCLIAAGADIDAADWTPLMEAAYYHKDMAELLIAEGADINRVSSSGWTVLNGALDANRLDIAELLLERGVKPNTKGENLSALHFAAWYRPHFFDLLIAKGADVNAKDWRGWTPLHLADPQSMEWLITKGADINARTNRGETVLHLCSESGDKEKAKLALSKGINIDAKDNLGWTALHRAAVFNHPDVAGILIDHGADVNLKDNDDNTPLNLAVETGHTEIVELLRKHGATG